MKIEKAIGLNPGAVRSRARLGLFTQGAVLCLEGRVGAVGLPNH